MSDKKEKEIKLWGRCKTNGDYESYLSCYPHGKFADMAKKKIKDLEDKKKEEKEKEKAMREASRETMEKGVKEWDVLYKCKTTEDYQRFIETNPSVLNKMIAQSRIDALKAEPVNLAFSLIINILSITVIIIGLLINNMKFIGFALLILGIIASITRLIAVKKWKKYWEYYGADNPLTASAIVLIIIGAIVSFRMLIISY